MDFARNTILNVSDVWDFSFVSDALISDVLGPKVDSVRVVGLLVVI